MASVLAGIKRSHDEMTAGDGETIRSPSRTSITSPATRTSSSRDTHPTNGVKNGHSTMKSRKVPFEAGVSLVLIGVRGVGKKTLGYFAATAFQRRLIDTERAFIDSARQSGTAYRKAEGAKAYQQRRNDVLTNLLRSHDKGAVIICSFSDLEGDGGRILEEFSQTHPVVHISRDPEGIAAHLKVWTLEKTKDLLAASNGRLRACTNFEFFNLSEMTTSRPPSAHPRLFSTTSKSAPSSGRFLSLKGVERDFVRFLRNVLGSSESTPADHTVYPFSKVRIEDRRHTLAVEVEMVDINSRKQNVEQLQIGADCIALIVDELEFNTPSMFTDLSRAFATIRRASFLPIMIHIRAFASLPSALEQRVCELTGFALRLGPELCTFDLRLPEPMLLPLLEMKGSCTTIADLHLNKRPPDGWANEICLSTYQSAARLGFEICRITWPAASAEDLFELRQFQRIVSDLRLPTRLAAFSTGHRGRLSRCFNPVLTSVNAPGKSDAPGDDFHYSGGDTATTLTRALFMTGIMEPLRFFLFGADVSYSVSPPMHNAAYNACALPHSYEARSSNNIEEVKRTLQHFDVGGCALAQPYKTAIVPLLDGMSPHAAVIGAANTIVPVRQLRWDGSMPDDLEVIARDLKGGPMKGLYGFNTDWIGIRACIRRGLSPANAVRTQTTAVVLGAGGMARSALYSLISLGVKNIFMWNRSQSKAVAIADQYNELIQANKVPELDKDDRIRPRLHVLDSLESTWSEVYRLPTIIVSCIPIQTPGQTPTNISLSEAWLKSPTGGVLLEVAYRQPVSPIEKQIRAKADAGWIFMDGFDMLPEQAYAQFELLTGRRAPRNVMWEEMTKHRPAKA